MREAALSQITGIERYIHNVLGSMFRMARAYMRQAGHSRPWNSRGNRTASITTFTTSVEATTCSRAYMKTLNDKPSMRIKQQKVNAINGFPVLRPTARIGK
eukprot:TRINITY_DN24585_c0_g1_i2.p3 TRINITY_DN24585_c0_g1~~TRINITY_DN24585_c0_g1_i2.p3  ORF type:complete len:101 (-),score=6.59 TRINITY_DN24585_c0_g1_i2:136-438(-)